MCGYLSCLVLILQEFDVLRITSSAGAKHKVWRDIQQSSHPSDWSSAQAIERKRLVPAQAIAFNRLVPTQAIESKRLVPTQVIALSMNSNVEVNAGIDLICSNTLRNVLIDGL